MIKINVNSHILELEDQYKCTRYKFFSLMHELKFIYLNFDIRPIRLLDDLYIVEIEHNKSKINKSICISIYNNSEYIIYTRIMNIIDDIEKYVKSQLYQDICNVEELIEGSKKYNEYEGSKYFKSMERILNIIKNEVK